MCPSENSDRLPSKASDSWRRVVLEHALDAVVGIDSDDLIIDWNRQAELTFGWSREQALGRKMSELIVPPEMREGHLHGMRRFLDTGEARILNRRVELDALHRNGSRFPVELTVIPVPTEGTYLFYSFVRDISDRARAESDHAFRSMLSTRLARAVGADEVISETTSQLGQYLNVSRCWLSEIDEAKVEALVHQDYRLGLQSLQGKYALMTFGAEMVAAWRGGGVVSVTDVRTDSRTRDQADAHLSLGIRSFVTVPLHRGGVLIAALNASSVEPRDWKAAELELIRSVAEHLWSLVENARLFEKMKSSESRLRFITDSLPAFVSYVGRDLRYQMVNSAYKEGFRRGQDEILGKFMSEVTGPEVWPILKPYTDRVLAGEAVQFETAMPELGPGRFFQTHYVPDRAPDGSIVGFIILGQEVTALKSALVGEKNAREEAERAHARMMFLAKASSELLSSLDYEATLKTVADLAVPAFADWVAIDLLNPDGELERLAVKHSDPALIDFARDLQRRFPQRLDPKYGVGKVLQTGQSETYFEIPDELLKLSAQSAEHYEILKSVGMTSVIIVPLSARGKAFGIMAFIRAKNALRYNEGDVLMAEEIGRRAGLAIDNARLYAAAKDAVRIRDEFISICSHELKTPVTSMKLQFQIAARQIRKGDTRAFDPELVERRVHIANRQLDRMTALIDDMLDVSRIAAGKLAFDRKELDFYDLTLEVVDRFREQFQVLGLDVDISARPRQSIVTGDRYRLDQVISNLLTNAIKYGAGKPVEISITSTEKSLVLTVRDQGIGIEKASLDRIFRRYERAVEATNISGMGLGLYISHQIVQGHGGRIWAESVPGQGSRFHVELPLAHR